MKLTRTHIAVGCLWAARLLALLLCLCWGAFFLEHLAEWFLRPAEGLPPVRVWVGQALHLLMLLGLAATMVWPLRGAGAAVLATAAFFSVIGYQGAWWIPLMNALPLVLVLVSRTLDAGRPAGDADGA